jgi:hypothetical protein
MPRLPEKAEPQETEPKVIMVTMEQLLNQKLDFITQRLAALENYLYKPSDKEVPKG